MICRSRPSHCRKSRPPRCRPSSTRAATSTAIKSRFITTRPRSRPFRSKANLQKLFDLRSIAMLRLPAVSGRFYPSNPAELTALIRQYTEADCAHEPVHAKACLVPHAGYFYSGLVAGAVYARMVIPKKILILGVRHYPHGENARSEERRV